MPAHIPWKAQTPADYRGPRIALVHGLLAGSHMQRHLLSFLRAAGYADTSLYSNHENPRVIARELAEAAKAGRPIVLVGYSQGGFQVLKVASLLQAQHISCPLVVSLAAGGAGRFYPSQWGFELRRIPGNIARYLNYFAIGDTLGTDRRMASNMAHAEAPSTQLENIEYSRKSGVDHFEIVRCYPAERVKPEVRTRFLERLLRELAAL